MAGRLSRAAAKRERQERWSAARPWPSSGSIDSTAMRSPWAAPRSRSVYQAGRPTGLGNRRPLSSLPPFGGTMAKSSTRAWQRMLSGRRLDILDPSPVDVELTDIAHGLARVARWNGQTKGDYPFSVAQHSILVLEIFAAMIPDAGPEARLAALLHDAPEYVMGDIISPFKAAMGGNYKEVEDRL